MVPYAEFAYVLSVVRVSISRLQSYLVQQHILEQQSISSMLFSSHFKTVELFARGVYGGHCLRGITVPKAISGRELLQLILTILHDPRYHEDGKQWSQKKEFRVLGLGFAA